MGQNLVFQQQHQQHHQPLSDDETSQHADQHSDLENLHHNNTNNTTQPTPPQPNNTENPNPPTHQLLFGGAPMIIDGLLNQDFFSNSNSEELINLFGYYGGVEGLLGGGGGGNDDPIHGGGGIGGGVGGDGTTSFRKFEFKETMLLRNDINLQLNSIQLIPSSFESEKYQLSFKFNVRSSFVTSSGGNNHEECCKVIVILKAREIMVDGKVAYVSSISDRGGGNGEIVKSFKIDEIVKSSMGDGETRVDLNSDENDHHHDDHHHTYSSSRRDYSDSTIVEYLNEILIDFKKEFPNREDLQYNNSNNSNNSTTTNSGEGDDDDVELQQQLIPLVIILSCDTSTQYSLCSLEVNQSSNNNNSDNNNNSSYSYSIKVNKQKVLIGDMNELVQVGEIYQQSTTTSSNHHADHHHDHHHHEEEEEENLCVICMSEEANIVVLPCGHMSLCEGCASALKEQTNKCPICRQRVESAIKLPSKE